MKQILRLITIAIVASTTTQYPMTQKIKIKVFNDLGITSPATVTVDQKTKKIYRNAEFQVSSEPSNNAISIQAAATINGQKSNAKQDYTYQALANREPHVQRQGSGIIITLLPAIPKKNKIVAFNKTDQTYRVTISDAGGGILATSKFITSTKGPFTGSLYTRLNHTIENNVDSLKKYNKNIIKIAVEEFNSSEKEKASYFEIFANDTINVSPNQQFWFEPGLQMFFENNNSVTIADKTGKVIAHYKANKPI